MTMNHTAIDPYTAEGGYFECVDCGAREASEGRLVRCPACEGRVRNIAVPRE